MSWTKEDRDHYYNTNENSAGIEFNPKPRKPIHRSFWHAGTFGMVSLSRALQPFSKALIVLAVIVAAVFVVVAFFAIFPGLI